MTKCTQCGADVPEAISTCESCGEPLAGMEQVALETLQEEASVGYGLLKSAGLHPVLAYVEEDGEPHPVDPEFEFGRSAGLLTPITLPFGVYVPEVEAEEARRVLKDASRPFEEVETGD